MKRATFQLETLTCPTCIKKIEEAVGRMDGVRHTKVLFNSNKVMVNFEETKVAQEDIKGTIEREGYDVKS